MDLERPNKETRVGGETEAFCTKCKRDTTHRIVTIEGGKVRKVQCQACSGQHIFRAPKGADTEPAAERPSAPRIRKSRAKAPADEPSQVIASDDEFEVEPIDYETFAEEVLGSVEALAAKEKAKGSRAKAKDAKAKKAATRATDPSPEDLEDDDLSVLRDLEGLDDGELDALAANPFDDDLDVDIAPKPKAKARAKAKAKTPAIKRTKEQKRQDDLKEQHSMEWNERTKGINPDKATPYAITGSYDYDQPIRHKQFGVGYVTKVVPPNKIHVKFKDETKILITNEPAEKLDA